MPASKNCIVVNSIYKQEVTCKLLYYKWHIWSGVGFVCICIMENRVKHSMIYLGLFFWICSSSLEVVSIFLLLAGELYVEKCGPDVVSYLMLACWWILASGVFNVLIEGENQLLANFQVWSFLTNSRRRGGIILDWLVACHSS